MMRERRGRGIFKDVHQGHGEHLRVRSPIRKIVRSVNGGYPNRINEIRDVAFGLTSNWPCNG
jgi:hypothetical protein